MTLHGGQRGQRICRMRRACVLLLLVINAGAQTSHPPLDCKRFDSSPACLSFSAMLTKGEKGVVDAMSRRNRAVVCFRPGEDTFILVSYPSLDDQAFTPASTDREQTSSTVTAMVYKNQKPDDLRHWKGHWTKRSDEPREAAMFVSGPGEEGTARIDKSDVLISYDFMNSEKKITYQLQVSRPGLRGIETFRPETSATQAQASKTLTDQCAEFH